VRYIAIIIALFVFIGCEGDSSYFDTPAAKQYELESIFRQHFNHQRWWFEPSLNTVTIELLDLDWSDLNCYEAAELIYDVCSMDVIVYLVGPFIPSRVNPIDFEWAQDLLRDAIGPQQYGHDP